jgi:hypothetical protein
MAASRQPGTHRRRRAGALWPVVLAVGALAIATGVVGVVHSLPAEGGETHDLRGRSVTLDPGETPIPAAESRATADTGERLVVPSVGLDVPVGALNAVAGQITPPGFTSAYWVRNLGVPVSASNKGTVFVVMHSLRGGAVGPGNYLTDVIHQRSKVADGAAVTIAGSRFTVTGSTLVSKSQIASAADVWADTPNRLLLITCLENADGTPSTENLVITAHRS